MSALSKKDISQTLPTSYGNNKQTHSDDSETASQRVSRDAIELTCSASLLVLKDYAACVCQEFVQVRALPIFSKPSSRFVQVARSVNHLCIG